MTGSLHWALQHTGAADSACSLLHAGDHGVLHHGDGGGALLAGLGGRPPHLAPPSRNPPPHLGSARSAGQRIQDSEPKLSPTSARVDQKQEKRMIECDYTMFRNKLLPVRVAWLWSPARRAVQYG